MADIKSPKIIKKSKRRSSSHKKLDKKKEEYIRMLSSIVEAAGYSVRRERLKRGPNWTAQSGICSVHNEPVVFVDRTVSQDDQLDFILSAMRDLGIQPDEKSAELLPEPLKKMLAKAPLAEVA